MLRLYCATRSPSSHQTHDTPSDPMTRTHTTCSVHPHAPYDQPYAQTTCTPMLLSFSRITCDVMPFTLWCIPFISICFPIHFSYTAFHNSMPHFCYLTHDR